MVQDAIKKLNNGKPTSKVTAMTLTMTGATLVIWFANTYVFPIWELPTIEDYAQGLITTFLASLVGYFIKDKI